MRRSICYCDPSYALAGQVGEWRFIYTTASKLPKGTSLRFDLGSDGRPIDWEPPEAGPRASANALYGMLDDDKVIHAKEVENPESFVPFYDFVLPTELEEGENFTIAIGPGATGDVSVDDGGNGAQCYVQRRRPFLLYIDTSGKGYYEDPEVFIMDIRGNELENIKVVAPSSVVKNKRFDVTIRFEDAYGNLTAQAPEGTLIELTYEHLRENLNWKIFVPETGFITLPNLYFNEPGIYTIQLTNLHTQAKFRSSPIRCTAEAEPNIYWGLLHGESERVDSTDNIEACMRHFRDDRAISFYGASPFDDNEETPTDVWKAVNQNVAEFNESDRFVSLLGFQWVGKSGSEGVRHFVYSKDGKPILRSSDAKNSDLKKIYRTLSPNDVMAIPTFTTGKGHSFDFQNWDPEFEKVVEIYNAWGCAENSAKQGNKFPVKTEDKNGFKEDPKGSIIDALKRNCRFGFVGGGLDDRGIYSELYDSGQVQYAAGFTAIVAADHTRDALFKALSERSCYATTGERILLGFSVSGTAMGQETCTSERPGLAINRHISGHVAGTGDVESIEIIRNGDVVHTIKPDGYSSEFTYDDMEPIDKACLSSPDKKPPFLFYYLRITQKDGNMAWSSPVWVDHDAEAKPRPAKKK